MSNESPTQAPSFFLENALKGSTDGQKWPPPAGHFVLNKERGETNFVPGPSTILAAIPAKQIAEIDPAGLAASQPGAKLDAGKVDVLRGAIQYFPRTLRAIAYVSERGAQKYSWKGWESVPDGIRRYGAALVRHLFHDDPFATDDGKGGLGPEVLHAVQVAWNACARAELILKQLEEKYE
jgi:hypothetical protein